jgi:hypothetical protein
MWRSPLCSAVAVLATAWCCAAPALAQITLDGGEVQVTTTTSASAYQGSPAVAWEPAGSYVIAWQQQSATVGGWDILGEQFRTNAGGPPAPLGPPFQVSGTSSAFCRQSPAVASDAAGDFVIVWISNEESGGLHGIFGQRYNSAGQPQGQFQVNTTMTDDDQAPAVAMAADGRFLVVWQANAQDSSSWGIIARAYKAGGGGPASGEIAVNVTTAGAQHSPAVAYLPASAAEPAERFEVVWQSEGQDGAGAGASGIVGRAFDGAGNAQSGELAINLPATGAHAHPRIASDPSGNFVVAWEGLTAGGSVALVRRFNAAGTALSGQMMVDPSPTGPEHDPVVAANAVGEFVVAFDALGQDGSGTAVLIQAFDSYLSQRLGGKVQLNTTTDGDQAFPGVALSAGGSLLMAWQSQTPAADAMVITARAAALPLEFYTVAPCRMVDTRNANGPWGGPVLTSGQARNFPLLSAACHVPATAKALSINATAVVPSATGSLVIYPGDAATPLTSNLNFNAGTVRANNAIVSLSRNGDGSVTVLPTLGSGNQVHFIIDVNGYFQ